MSLPHPPPRRPPVRAHPATIPVVALLILMSVSSCADSSPSRSDSQPASCVRDGVEYPRATDLACLRHRTKTP